MVFDLKVIISLGVCILLGIQGFRCLVRKNGKSNKSNSDNK